MSIYPVFIQYERPTPRSMCNRSQNLTYGLTPRDYLSILAVPELQSYCRRNWLQQAAANNVDSTIKEDKQKFQVNLDVQHFAPEEISVKAVDKFLVVEAKHEEKEDDHGFVSRSFTRKYSLPEDVDADSITSKLSSDGVLTVSAPLKLATSGNERIVPIIQTGPVKKHVQNPEG